MISPSKIVSSAKTTPAKNPIKTSQLTDKQKEQIKKY